MIGSDVKRGEDEDKDEDKEEEELPSIKYSNVDVSKNTL